MILHIPVKSRLQNIPRGVAIVDVPDLAEQDAPVATRFRTQDGNSLTRWFDNRHWAALYQNARGSSKSMITHVDPAVAGRLEPGTADTVFTYFKDASRLIEPDDLPRWYAERVAIIDGAIHVSVPEPHLVIAVSSVGGGEISMLALRGIQKRWHVTDTHLGYSLLKEELAIEVTAERFRLPLPFRNRVTIELPEAFSADFRREYACQNVAATIHSIRNSLAAMPTEAIRTWLSMFRIVGERSSAPDESVDDMYTKLDGIVGYISNPIVNATYEVSRDYFYQRLAQSERQDPAPVATGAFQP